MVGGVEKDKTGYVKEAAALQSVVQLMGPRDMVDYWANTYKVNKNNKNDFFFSLNFLGSFNIYLFFIVHL